MAHGQPDALPGEQVEALIDAVLDDLEAQGHLSDSRFVESRIHARLARFGNRRIEAELQRHGLVADEDSRQALHDSEWQRACDVWARKFGRPAEGPADRARQHRFLATRGFSPDVIAAVLKNPAGYPGD